MNTTTLTNYLSITIGLWLILSSCASKDVMSVNKKDTALAKIEQLSAMMDEARALSLDVKREETLLWFAEEFIKFADWDEAHQPEIERLFGYYAPYEDQKAKYAAELPEFERQKVIDILDDGMATLQQVIDGEIVRPPVNPIEWDNIEVAKDALLSNGRPVFLFDYFSKSVGIPLTNTDVYNDHLGAIYHGGENLYPVDHDRAINSFLLNEDGTWDEELVKEVTMIPNTNTGFLLYWNLGIPEWVEKKEPQVRKGRSLFTGYDVDNPLVRDVWGKIVRHTGELTQGKKVTQLGYILNNEPHWYSEKDHWTARYGEMLEISTYTLDKFRAWLSKTYQGDIAALNANWGASYTAFEEVDIEMPLDKTALQGTPKWYDWCRYNMDRGTEWFQFIQDELHEVNPDADTHIKIMSRMFTEDTRSHGIDLEALTELTTMIGDDAKASGGRKLTAKKPESWEDKYAYRWAELASTYDFMESVSPDKIHVNSETHFISSSAWRDMETTPDYIRSVYWLATLHGMDVGISWFWARDPDGSPEDRLEGELDFFDGALAGSYAGSVNMQPQSANEVAQVTMDMNAVSEEIMALRAQRRPIRLFHSETSAINKAKHMSEQAPLYEAFYFEGIPVGYATEKILKKQSADDWDAVIVYRTEYATDTEVAALQDYLDEGGVVLVDELSLLRDQYGEERDFPLEGKGLKMIKSADDLAQIRAMAMSYMSTETLPVEIIESNEQNAKTCTWRIVPYKGGYLVNILNIGKEPSELKIRMKNGEKVKATDLLTQQELGDEMTLRTNGVLLLHLQS